MSARSDRRDGDGPTRARLARLEGALEALGRELRTQRLVVVDAGGTPRIAAEVVDGVAELRVEVERPLGASTTAVLVFAAGRGQPGEAILDPAIGVQLWTDGNALVELVASRDAEGRWRPDIHVAQL
jgi:hypothetical protein